MKHFKTKFVLLTLVIIGLLLSVGHGFKEQTAVLSAQENGYSISVRPTYHRSTCRSTQTWKMQKLHGNIWRIFLHCFNPIDKITPEQEVEQPQPEQPEMPQSEQPSAPQPEQPEPEQPSTPQPEQPSTPQPEQPSTPQPEQPEQEQPSVPQPEQPTPQPEQPQTTDLSYEQSRMLELINEERAKSGAKPLVFDEELAKVANAKAKDMVDNNYFSHDSPTYGSPFDMMKSFGIRYRAAGENLAGYNNVDKAHAGLMNSDGHRKNILNPNFTHVGIGVYKSPRYGYVFVQMFIGK